MFKEQFSNFLYTDNVLVFFAPLINHLEVVNRECFLKTGRF